jgi:hypothetical protein
LFGLEEEKGKLWGPPREGGVYMLEEVLGVVNGRYEVKCECEMGLGGQLDVRIVAKVEKCDELVVEIKRDVYCERQNLRLEKIIVPEFGRSGNDCPVRPAQLARG